VEVTGHLADRPCHRRVDLGRKRAEVATSGHQDGSGAIALELEVVGRGGRHVLDGGEQVGLLRSSDEGGERVRKGHRLSDVSPDVIDYSAQEARALAKEAMRRLEVEGGCNSQCRHGSVAIATEESGQLREPRDDVAVQCGVRARSEHLGGARGGPDDHRRRRGHGEKESKGRHGGASSPQPRGDPKRPAGTCC
jgi:hypothetical protein